VLLHGGLTDSRDFGGNLDALASQFRVYLPERRGHGHTADVEGPLRLELKAQDTVAFLETIVRRRARLAWLAGPRREQAQDRGRRFLPGMKTGAPAADAGTCGRLDSAECPEMLKSALKQTTADR
jgi:hypothetical protein